MSLRKIGFFTLSIVVLFLSCKNDDDGDDTITIEIADRTEQQVIDNDSIIGYLEAHYYNSGELGAANLDAGIRDIVITELEEGETVPDGHTLLMEAVGTSKKTVYEDTDYEYYVLNINQGGGISSPSFADTVQILYEGSNLDNSVFDSKFFPDDKPLDLTNLISGWRKVIPQFNEAESFITGDDGSLNYYNCGLGIMFLPSGLGYFSSATTGSSYAPLIFKFELLKTFENDHDFDGVPSYLEDLNGDGEFIVDFDDLTSESDDDTDGDGIHNFVDNDDDGDGILTINEDLEDTDLNVDSDGDGDKTNDKNGDGDPTNDDTDGDGIPNYLDSDDTESKT